MFGKHDQREVLVCFCLILTLLCAVSGSGGEVSICL